MTRPCTAYRLVTLFRLSPSEAVAAEREETMHQLAMEEMQGKVGDLVRVGRGRAVMPVVVAVVVVTAGEEEEEELPPGSREMVEMLGKSK